MIIGRWLRILFRPPRALTIELVAGDRLMLGMKICNLSEAERSVLPWSDAEWQKLFKRLMARNSRGYDGWHPRGPALVPVTLQRTEWQMIEQLCSELAITSTDSWPSRVLTQIRDVLFS